MKSLLAFLSKEKLTNSSADQLFDPSLVLQEHLENISSEKELVNNELELLPEPEALFGQTLNVAQQGKGPFTHSIENAVIEASSMFHRSFIDVSSKLHRIFRGHARIF